MPTAGAGTSRAIKLQITFAALLFWSGAATLYYLYSQAQQGDHVLRVFFSPFVTATGFFWYAAIRFYLWWKRT